MTKHRGFEIPTPEEYKGYYLIHDDFGWFESRTEKDAVLHWKNKVDSTLIKFYMDEDKIKLWGRDDYACVTCGAILADVFAHIRYHEAYTVH